MLDRKRKLTVSAAIDAYLNKISLAGRARTTITLYGYVLRALARHVGEGRSVRGVGEDEIVAYLRLVADRDSKGYSLLVGRIIKGLCNWLKERGEISTDLLAGLKLGTAPVAPVKPFSDEEVDKLVAACETAFERALVYILLDTGLRASELCGLSWADLDMERGILLVTHGKGGKARRVALNDIPQKALEEYMDSCSLADGRIWPQGFNRATLARALDKVAQRAQVTDCHPHRFRHTFATRFLRESHGDALALKQLLGHSSLVMVERYTMFSESERALDIHRHMCLVA